MKRYLIALDMDGTLLNDEKDITPLTKKALITLKNIRLFLLQVDLIERC